MGICCAVVVSVCCLYNVWRCLQLSLSISLITSICEESDDDTDDGDDFDDDLEGAAPTSKCWRLAREDGLERSLVSGLYPQFIGYEGPSQLLEPSENNKLAFLQLVWSTSLHELIAVETNKYAQQNNCGLMLVPMKCGYFWGLLF